MRRLTSILCIWNPRHPRHVLIDSLRLAKVHGARFTVLDAVEALPPDLGMLMTDTPLAQAQAAGMEERRERITAALAEMPRKHPQIRIVSAAGQPFLTAVQEAIRGGHDLVVKAAEGKNLASEDAHLVRKAPCSVWLVRQRPVRSLVAAMEPGIQDEVADELNAAILAAAAAWSRWRRARLHLATAWDAGRTRREAWGITLPSGQARSLDKEWETARRKWLAAFTGEHWSGRPIPRLHGLRGEPAEQIGRLVRHVRADLLVLGALGRPGVPGLLIGRTAENLLARIGCSVLVIKPSWFVSPMAAETDSGG